MPAARQLKAMHTATHPGRTPLGHTVSADAPDSDRAALLATLDVEAAGEAGGDV